MVEENYNKLQEKIKQLRLQVEEIKSSNNNFSVGEQHLDNLSKGLNDIQKELDETQKKLERAISILENPEVNNLLSEEEKRLLKGEINEYISREREREISLDKLTTYFENLLNLADEVINANNEDAKNKFNQATNDLQKLVEDMVTENKKLSNLVEIYRKKIMTLTEQTKQLKETSGKINILSATLLLGVGSLATIFLTKVLKWTGLFKSKKNV